MKTPTDLKLNTVNTWIINVNDVQHKIEVFKQIINIDENSRAEKFRFKKDKHLFIIARAALRLLSGKYLNIKPETITFKYGKYGKPAFDFDSSLKFNISHSGDMVILSFVIDYDIGADIENIRDDFDVLDIATNYFSELEIETLKKVPKEKLAEYFYRCWTRKESFIKAKSQGLSFPLNSFSVCIKSDKKTELLETKWDDEEKNTWKLFTFSPIKDYVAAISIKGNIQSVEYYDFNIFIKTSM